MKFCPCEFIAELALLLANPFPLAFERVGEGLQLLCIVDLACDGLAN
jgi:hypothetical protein